MELSSQPKCYSWANAEILEFHQDYTGYGNLKELRKLERSISAALYAYWFPGKRLVKTLEGAPVAPFPYYVSNSHSQGHFFWARKTVDNIGIDFQVFTDKCLRVEKKFMNKEEWFRCPEDLINYEYAVLFWSIKEAAYKWHKKHIALKDILVSNIDFVQHKGTLIFNNPRKQQASFEFKRTPNGYCTLVWAN